MSNPLGHLMERNVLEVLSQRNADRRMVAISELYTEGCTFFEAGALYTFVDGVASP